MIGEPIDVPGCLARYLSVRQDPAGRFASFDYSYNYFQAFAERDATSELARPEQLQVSCLQLGFYLASWGMYRGSTQLLRRSLPSLVPALEVIAAAPRQVWDVDVDHYDTDTIDLLLRVGRDLADVLPGGQSATLVTKTMLGVFGCVPAFDTYVKRGLGAWTFGPKALRRVAEFHRDHREAIEQHRVHTWDFQTRQMTERRYPQAKVIDMVFFIHGGG